MQDQFSLLKQIGYLPASVYAASAWSRSVGNRVRRLLTGLNRRQTLVFLPHDALLWRRCLTAVATYVRRPQGTMHVQQVLAGMGRGVRLGKICEVKGGG
jgi:hypothetical protein